MLDTETAPKLANVWGLFKQNVGINQIVKDMYVLCWSAKWYGSDTMMSDALHYHSRYKRNNEDDTIIIKSVWKLLDEADFVVAHNGNGFDIPTLNSRFIILGMQPPSPYKVIDTLSIARSNFKFTSNKLDFLGQALVGDHKIATGGFKLWSDIIQNKDDDAFDRMVEYCEQDVYLLEKVYDKLKPWNKTAGRLDLKDSELKDVGCNSCGSSNVKKNGKYATNTGVYQQHKCNDCGHNMRSRFADKTTAEQKRNILRSM